MPNYPQGRILDGYRGRWFMEEIINGIRVLAHVGIRQTEETAVEFSPRPRQRGLPPVDLRPQPAKMAPFIAGPDTFSAESMKIFASSASEGCNYKRISCSQVIQSGVSVSGQMPGRELVSRSQTSVVSDAASAAAVEPFRATPGTDTSQAPSDDLASSRRNAPAARVWQWIFSHFGRDRFGRHVFTLMSGSAAAQALTLALVPVLTRLYVPENFGVLALYSSLLFISMPLVSVRYEMAIVPAEDDDEAFGLVLLSCGIAILFGLSTSLLMFPRLTALLRMQALQRYIWLVPFSVTVTGFYQAVRQYRIRKKQFHSISFSQIAQSGGAAVAQVGSALIQASAWGLLFGQLSGLLASTYFLARDIRSAWDRWHCLHQGQFFATLRTLAVRYRRHPAFLPWAGFVDSIAQRLPVLMLSGFYGPYFLGLYAVADRIIRMPISLVGQNCAPVLFQNMSEQHTKARISSVLIKWGVGMSAFFVLPAAVLYLASRFLFAVILGKTWAAAGSLAVALIPIYWGALVVSPVSGLLIIANRQGLYFLIQALFLASGFCSLWLGHHWMMSGEKTVLLYSAIQFLVYLVYFAALFSAGRAMMRKPRT